MRERNEPARSCDAERLRQGPALMKAEGARRRAEAALRASPPTERQRGEVGGGAVRACPPRPQQGEGARRSRRPVGRGRLVCGLPPGECDADRVGTLGLPQGLAEHAVTARPGNLGRRREPCAARGEQKEPDDLGAVAPLGLCGTGHVYPGSTGGCAWKETAAREADAEHGLNESFDPGVGEVDSLSDRSRPMCVSFVEATETSVTGGPRRGGPRRRRASGRRRHGSPGPPTPPHRQGRGGP